MAPWRSGYARRVSYSQPDVSWKVAGSSFRGFFPPALYTGCISGGNIIQIGHLVSPETDYFPSIYSGWIFHVSWLLGRGYSLTRRPACKPVLSRAISLLIFLKQYRLTEFIGFNLLPISPVSILSQYREIETVSKKSVSEKKLDI